MLTKKQYDLLHVHPQAGAARRGLALLRRDEGGAGPAVEIRHPPADHGAGGAGLHSSAAAPGSGDRDHAAAREHGREHGGARARRLPSLGDRGRPRPAGGARRRRGGVWRSIWAASGAEAPRTRSRPWRAAGSAGRRDARRAADRPDRRRPADRGAAAGRDPDRRAVRDDVVLGRALCARGQGRFDDRRRHPRGRHRRRPPAEHGGQRRHRRGSDRGQRGDAEAAAAQGRRDRARGRQPGLWHAPLPQRPGQDPGRAWSG